MATGYIPTNQFRTRTTPTGDYRINAWGGTTYTPNPGRVTQDRTALQQQTGQVMPPAYDVPGGGGGGSFGGSRVGGADGYSTETGLGGPYTSPGGGSIVTSPGGGGGNINLSRDAYEAQQAMLLKNKLATDALGKITAGGSNTPGQVQYGGASADAARAAAFARAKEQAGANAQASLRALQDSMSQRGLHGSSIEAGAIGSAVQSGGSDIAQFITDQLNQDLQNQQHVNDVTYQGGITQRGQDMQAQQALKSLLIGLY